MCIVSYFYITPKKLVIYKTHTPAILKTVRNLEQKII